MPYTYPNDFAGTGWLVIDGDIYVSSTSSDDTGEGTPANPYATIQKAVEEAVFGQKIVVGTGDYSGAVNGVDKENIFVADGIVVMYGDGTDTAFSNVANTTPTFSRLEGFYITGYAQAVLGRIGNVVNCIFENTTLEGFRGILQNCILSTVTLRATANTYLYNCTLIKVSTDNLALQTRFKEIRDCHIDSQTVLHVKSNFTIYFDFCNQEPGSIVNIDGNPYSDAASVHAAFPASPEFQTNGLSVLPKFSNPSKGDYSLTAASALNIAGSHGSFIGAVGLANTENPFSLMGATLINVTINSDGKYELVDGYSYGTIETLEIDLGAKHLLGKINLFADETFETPPYNAVVDTDNSNTKKNKITFELRYSDFHDDVFNKPYLEYEWNTQPTVDKNGRGNGHLSFDKLSELPINARYVQVRITLRDDTNYLLQEDGSLILQEDFYGIYWM
jgi:hypothetical protein